MSLYVWGCNTEYQLGLSESSNITNWEPKPIVYLEEYLIVGFAPGDHHSLAVTALGDVYSWGRNLEGQCGHGSTTNSIKKPTKIKHLEDQTIVSVECGAMHSLAITASGQLYMWGLLHASKPTQSINEENKQDESENAEFQGTLTGMATEINHSTNLLRRIVRSSEEQYAIGEENSRENFNGMLKFQTIRNPCSAPLLCRALLGHKIASVSAGFAHTLALSLDGLVFSCGYNENGQLGLGHRISTDQFMQITALSMYTIVEITCGQQHNLARTIKQTEIEKSGLCFSWGLGSLGQLGIGLRKSQWLPCHVKFYSPVISIAAGSHHSVAVLDDGNVYTWGHSEYNQHGTTEHGGMDLQNSYYYTVLRKHPVLESLSIKSVTCGNHHSLALSEDKRIYSWGWNSYGVLGHGQHHYSTVPEVIRSLEGFECLKVVAGPVHCGVLTEVKGNLYALSYRKLLEDGNFYDVEFLVGKKNESVRAHRAILKARCPYLDGYIRSGESEWRTNEGTLMIQVTLENIEKRVFEAVLKYCYTDRLYVSNHLVRKIYEVAECFGLEYLKTICRYRLSHYFSRYSSEDSAVGSTFEEDMSQIIQNSVYSELSIDLKDEKNEVYLSVPIHKSILCQHEYFKILLTGPFREHENEKSIVFDCLNMHPLNGPNFLSIIRWIYCGNCCLWLLDPNWKDNPDLIMEIVATASLFGLQRLMNDFEFRLIQMLINIPSSSTIFYEFAERYGLMRLKTQSIALLEIEQLDGTCGIKEKEKINTEVV